MTGRDRTVSATASTAARWSWTRRKRLFDAPAGPEVAEAHGEGNRLGPRVHLKLGDRVAHMGVHGRRAEAEALGDLFHPQALGEKLEDLPLAGREIEQFLHLRGLAAGEIAAEEGAAVSHGFDRAGDVL